MKQKIETIDNKMEEKIDNKITIKLDNNENAKINAMEKKIDTVSTTLSLK